MVKLLIAMLLLCGVCKAETLGLTSVNTVTFRGEVSQESVAKAEYALVLLNAKRGTADYPIYLVMDSPGGDIMAGLDFIEFAKTIKNVKTVTIFAASMASAIVEHLPGERLTTTNGILMFHRARGGFDGQFEDGELESRLAFFKSLVRKMEQVNSDRMSMSLENYKAKVKDEWWMLGNQSVEAKAADRIAEFSCSSELIKAKDLIQVQSFFSVIDVEYSGCPLMRGGKIKEPKK